MTLGGLWHGASWTFVVWGVLHGLLLIGHRLFQRFCELRPFLRQVLQSWPGTAVRVLTTFLAVCVCWVFFRAQGIENATRMLGGLLRTSRHSSPLPFVGLFLTSTAWSSSLPSHG